MAQHGRPRAGIGRTSRPQRAWYGQLPSRKKGAPTKRSDNWVGSSLLTVMDRMEEHVDEVLSTNIGSGQTAASQAVSAVDTALIKQEIIRRLEEKISSLIDKATSSARLGRMESMQKLDRKNIQSLQTSYDYERRTIDDLDALHRHEHLLNSALVERLFQASALEGSIDPDAMFDKTTFGLQGTDSVISMLVSCVEKLILKVETLERKAEAMERCLVKKEE